MKRPTFRRCGTAPGALSPENQAVVDQFRAMLTAVHNPQPWMPGHAQHIAVRVGQFVERARLQPGNDPSVLVSLIPRAVHTRGVFLRHPHAEHGCGCEWDDTWRLLYAPPTEPGAIPITVMRHPVAQVAAAAIPSPDNGSVPATWAL
ncbi:hypothetical protein [Streptomyces goshikiensis]|uniref:hypothetical protein n=1 Tax=Streptomyces goshikiensis TaxID=1942 RepID=UPI002E10FEBC|nr:hypothetical protein OG224_39510 [Streptomyces goshikiensis]